MAPLRPVTIPGVICLFRLLFVSGLLILLGACSSGGGGDGNGADAAPRLDSISFDPASAAAGLTVTLSGSVDFADADGDLNDGSFNYTYEGTTYSIPLPPALAGITQGTAGFTLEAVLSSNTGALLIPCWLVDRAGHRSNTLEVTFTQLWTRQFGTLLEDLGQGIAADSAGNLFVAGTTWGNLGGQSNLGVSDVFVTGYAADTTHLWTRLLGSVSEDNGRAVAVDGNGNIYVAGDTLGTDFDGQVSDGSQDGFITRLDSSGNRLWTRLIGTAGTGDQAWAVVTDANHDIYVAGQTAGDLDGVINAGGWDAFLVKFDSDGNRLWTRVLGTTGSDSAYALTADASGGIYLSGGTDGVLGVDPSPGDPLVNLDVFVARYGADGTLQWVTQLGTACGEWARGISATDVGSLYVAGRIYQCAFAANSAAGGYDAFLARLDSSGNLQWVRQFGDSQHDSANAVHVDASGAAYVAGYFDSTYFIDDSEGGALFLARYDAAGNQGWLVQDSAGTSHGNQVLSVTAGNSDSAFLTGTVHGQLDGHANPAPGEDDAFILRFDAQGVRR